MAHIQYMPGDPRLVDQLVYELKSKGIFDQFRKDCIADVDTRPAYQNLRQRVENSVSTFLSRQTWQPDLNKNQLREKLRKHILDGNYLEQGVERIVDQVVNPKVASVFIPKVEDLVYNYLGIARKKSITAETSNGKVDDLLPTDLEAVSPGSVKSNDDKDDAMEVDETTRDNKMDIDEKSTDTKDNTNSEIQDEKIDNLSAFSPNTDFKSIPLPSEEIKPEDIPPPENSPPKIEVANIELPKEPINSSEIPLPDDISKDDKFFKPINSDDEDSSSDSSLRRNMSPLTPIRNFNNENSCDAQQAFENDSVDKKEDDKKEPSSFRFAIDAISPENSSEPVKTEKKDNESSLVYQFNNQVNINNFNTPLYEDSSNSNNLRIDYESDANSKVNQDIKVEETNQNSEDSKKERKPEEKKSSSSSNHKSSHRSRDSHKHSSSRDKKSDSKQSSSRDSSRHDKSKSSKEESKSKSSDKDKSRDRSEKKDSRESSRHRSSHKSSHQDSKSHRSSSSSHRHSSKHSDEKKSSSSSSHKDKSSDKSSSDKRKDSKSSHRSDKDRKSSSSSGKSERSSSKSKHDDKEKEKKKKEADDHYSLSGRGNRNRRSTDRDSNDGSSSSKGSTLPSSSKTSESKKESKSSSKSETTSTSGDSTSPSDKENIVYDHESKTKQALQHKPIVRIESHLEQPISSPPRLPFVPDITIKKPKFAANLEEAKRLMKMRKFLDEEQKRMNQEAALLLEFQANVRPSLSQVYSSIPGPELEFACVTNAGHKREIVVQSNDNISNDTIQENQKPHYTSNQLLNVLNDASVIVENNLMNNEESVVKDDVTTPSEEMEQSNNGKNSEEDIRPVENINIKTIESDKTNEKLREKQQIDTIETIDSTAVNNMSEENSNNQTERFVVTVIAEALSESEEVHDENSDSLEKNNNKEKSIKILGNNINDGKPNDQIIEGEKNLHYFAEHEKYNAEIERAKFSQFFKKYNEKCFTNQKLYLINCDSYEENIIKEEAKNFGDFEIVSYHKNGHLKLPKTKNVIKNVNISNEISLPIDGDYDRTHIFSPEKSECSFELSSDYNAKLEEMVTKTSRQEIMEIILGNVGESPSKMPRIDYLTDSNIDSEYEYNKKRKISDVETTVNNNRNVLTPNKIRKLSTEQITSTTEEAEIEHANNKIINNTRSKYLGKARRVGLPRPKKSILPNSPSSDKSVENYEQNTPTTPQTPNGKLKRTKVQRYDTSDLYKPKLHFLSRRNHIT